MVEQYKGYVGKPALELAAVLNKDKIRYKIVKPGQSYTPDYTNTRLTIKVDANWNVATITTS